MSNEREFLIVNGAFSDGWDDLPPAPGNLVNQQPRGWQLRWLEPGEKLWDSADTAQGVPECVHKHTDQLPLEEQPGQPGALILAGAFVYKIFHAGAPFGAELRQTVADLPPGARITVTAPVLIDGHGETDIFGAEAGLWVNGQGEWRNFGQHGDRKWHTHTRTVVVPPSGVAEVMIRVKSKWPAPKDFFIDDVRMEVVATPEEAFAPEVETAAALTRGGVGQPLVDIDRIRAGLDPWDGFPLIPAEADDSGAIPADATHTAADVTVVVEPEAPAIVDAGVLVNGSFEQGWDDLPPAPGNLVNQQPKGWRLTWVEPGQRLWESADTAQGVPECVHKHADHLPPDEQPGQPGALILDGEWVYKIFHFGAAFGAELFQAVASLKPGTQATVQAPVLIDGHGETDIFSAEAGLWVNGQGEWHNLERHGNRKWHTHARTVIVPDTGVVEIVLRVKSKWPAPKDFFIDHIRLEAVPAEVRPPVEPPVEPAEEAHMLTPTDFELKVRSGPGLQHEIRTVVNPGDRLVVLEDWDGARAKVGAHGQWINVRAPNGVEGWSAAWILTFVEQPGEPPVEPAEEAHVLTPTDFELKVRSGPGLQHEIRTVVNPGDRLVVLEDWDGARAKVGAHGQWINVRAPNGVEGWSAAWILTFVEAPKDEEPKVVAQGLYPLPMERFTFTNDFDGEHGHKGWDLSAAVGETVFCGPNGGRVVRAMRCTKCTDDKPSVQDHGIPLDDPGVLGNIAWAWGFGHHVIMRYLNSELPESTRQALAAQGHEGWHIYCMYAHLHSIDVAQGDMLTERRRIGACGNTGNSSGPHLHLEVRAGANPDDMGRWLSLALLEPSILFVRP